MNDDETLLLKRKLFSYFPACWLYTCFVNKYMIYLIHVTRDQWIVYFGQIFQIFSIKLPHLVPLPVNVSPFRLVITTNVPQYLVTQIFYFQEAPGVKMNSPILTVEHRGDLNRNNSTSDLVHRHHLNKESNFEDLNQNYWKNIYIFELNELFP